MGWLGGCIGFILGGPIGGILGHILTSPPYETPDHSVDSSGSVPRKFGDVLCARRSCYLHFGICSGEDSVIHFSDNIGKDISSCNEVIETDFKTFEKGDVTYVVSFPEEHSGTIVYRRTVDFGTSYLSGSVPQLSIDFEAFLRRIKEIRSYKLHTPEETVERARSKLGEKGYDLVKNNCEHFAIWCKTGVHESHQIEKLLGTFEFISVKTDMEKPVFEIIPYKSLPQIAFHG